MPELVVLGGARLLGPEVISRACDLGWSVTVVNRGSVPPGGYPSGVRHVVADRGDSTRMHALANRPVDAVIDLSCYQPEHAELAFEAFAGRCGRYLMMSSGAVYAESALQPLGEDTPAVGRPLWGAYGVAKVEIERLSRAWAGRLPIVLVRPPYIVGERDFMDRLPFVFDRVRDADDLPVLVPDSGKAGVQLVAAGDVAAACLMLLDAAVEPSAYNVGPSQWTTLAGLVELCAQALELPPPEVAPVALKAIGLSDEPYVWSDAIFPFADQHYVLDTRKLAAAGFDAYEDLASLIERLAGAYLRTVADRPPLERNVNELRAYEQLGISPTGRKALRAG